ncbi:MAG: alpha/beta fold hydrolase [Ilumatobacteraceae bacterium]
MTIEIMPGAEAWSADGGSLGVLCLHGFTGNPSTMRPIAEAAAEAGYSVELPRLPGHGTTIEDMLSTGFRDWAGEAEAAYQRLAARTDRIVVAGLSMGGALTLHVGLAHPDVAGLICINPVTKPLDPEILEMARGMLAEGTTVIPGIGSDIADPDAVESAYPGTPLQPLFSMIEDGIMPMTDRFGELSAPLLLMTSPQDHVVDPSNSDHLAETAGGPVERVSLERSYHVATLDFDRDLVIERVLDFLRRRSA